MEYETLLNLYNDLKVVVESGDEARTQALLTERFSQLPEDMQGELLTRMYFNALQEDVEMTENIAEIQTKALAALDALDLLKKRIEEGGDTSNS